MGRVMERQGIPQADTPHDIRRLIPRPNHKSTELEQSKASFPYDP